MLRALVRVLVSASLPIVLGASSCPPPAPDPIATSLGRGWNCLAAPTAFDLPGSVFRVDPDGVKFTVGDYSSRAGIVTSPFPNLTATQTVVMDAGLVAQLLRISIGVNAGAHRNYTVTQTFGNAKALNTTDDSVSDILTALRDRRDVRERNRYYLVRGAVSASRITYDFDSNISASFGADVAVKVARVSPKASYSDREGFRYDSTFEPPANVCILADEVTAFLSRSASLPKTDSDDGEFVNVMDSHDRRTPFSDPDRLFVTVGGAEM